MIDEKNLQEKNLQDEMLSDEELDQVAGGVGTADENNTQTESSDLFSFGDNEPDLEYHGGH